MIREERELSLMERFQIHVTENFYTGAYNFEESWVKDLCDKRGIPTKQITVTHNDQTNMEKLIEKLKTLQDRQKELMSMMSEEKYDNFISVLRAKGYADSIIELEAKIEVLMDAISILR
jgi:tRNA(Ile)-lysidine synthase TilS/MesJ